MIGTDPEIALIDALRGHPSEAIVCNGRRAGEISRELDALAERHFTRGLERGEIVALTLDNDVESILGLLLVLRLGCVGLAISPGSTVEERKRIFEANQCRREVVFEDGLPCVCGPPSAKQEAGPGILLATSGSTGAIKFVHRSEASLRSEALRYRNALDLKHGTRIVIHAPIAHAYAIGWLAAGLWTGGEIVLVKPTHFSRTVHEISQGACWMVTTPSLARLLSRRPLPPGAGPFEELRVMAGAGPVDATLDDAFQSRFGVRLARNYGSTETGTVCWGPAGSPYGSVGSPMPGLEVRTVDLAGQSCIAPSQGVLEVRLENGSWHDMGDLASVGREGLVTLHGRRSKSVRRADQWISTLEIEEAARAQPGVRAALARAEPGSDGQEDRLILDVWPDSPDTYDSDKLRVALCKTLSQAKWPNDVRAHSHLRQSTSGKVQASPVYRLAGAAALLAATRAYKRSELAFALHRLGVLERLDRGSSVHDIAAELGLDHLALEIALEDAERLGLVVPVDTHVEPPSKSAMKLVDLEYVLSESWTTRDRITQTLKLGLLKRPPLENTSAILPLYQAAMHGEITRFRRALALRRLDIQDTTRLVEITSGPGDYCVAVNERWSLAKTTLWRVGALKGPTHERLRSNPQHSEIDDLRGEEVYDCCVIFNAIHLSDIASRLSWIWSRLQPGSRLVVDDLFLLQEDEFSAELGIDWLTHGGNALRTLPELRQAMELLGARVEIVELCNAPHVNLLFAYKEEGSA